MDGIIGIQLCLILVDILLRVNNLHLICCRPVSYTHLDVYKRQLLLQTEKRQDEKAEARQKTLLPETEERRLQEAEERKLETEDIKALIQEQKQTCLLYTSRCV